MKNNSETLSERLARETALERFEGITISGDSGAISIKVEGSAYRNLEKLRDYFDTFLKGPLSKPSRESFPKASEEEKSIRLHEILFFLADGLRGNPPSVAAWWLFESRLACLQGVEKDRAEEALEAIPWE